MSVSSTKSRSSTVILSREHQREDRLDVECWYLPQRSLVPNVPMSSQSRKPSRPVKSKIGPNDVRRRNASTRGRDRQPRSESRAGRKSNAELIRYETQEDLNQVRQLWRVFRRRMRAEQAEAIREKDRQEIELATSMRVLEQERELQEALAAEPLLFVDCWNENADEDHRELVPSESNPKEDEGSFWEFFHFYKKKVKHDSDTASTSANTSIADDHSLHSHASTQSWQSVATEKATNRRFLHRDLLWKHYSGGDDPWSAAHRGDMDALETRWKNRHDWTLEDDAGNPPLYYACAFGGATNLRVVLFLLQQWPSTQHIPSSLMDRCKMDAANGFVLQLLNHPNDAEYIIQEAEEAYSHDSHEDYHNNNSRLFDILEERDA